MMTVMMTGDGGYGALWHSGWKKKEDPPTGGVLRDCIYSVGTLAPDVDIGSAQAVCLRPCSFVFTHHTVCDYDAFPIVVLCLAFA